MSYNKRVWANGDLITKERMNNIEDGIYNAHEEINTLKNNTSTGGSNINDTAASATTTYSSNKIESIKEGLSSQIKDITNKVGNVSLPTTSKTLTGAIAETFQSVSNGKTLIASAITDKGVITSSSDSFSTMANNIKSIEGTSNSPIYRTINNKLYRQVLNEDFDDILNKNIWVGRYLTTWTNKEYLSRADYKIENSCLSLMINEDSSPWNPTNDGDLRISGIQTGELSGLHKKTPIYRNIDKFLGFIAQYGYFEVRAKMFPGSGTHCAWWMVGLQDNDTQMYEIDIFENLGGTPTVINTTSHNWDGDEAQIPLIRYDTNVNLSDDFHTYGFEWTENEMIFYFDGVRYHSGTTSVMYPLITILSCYEARSGNWTGSFDNSIPYPKEFKIDYIKVYKEASLEKDYIEIESIDKIRLDSNSSKTLDEYSGVLKELPSYCYVNWNDGSRTEHWVKWKSATPQYITNLSNQNNFHWEGKIVDIERTIEANIMYGDEIACTNITLDKSTLSFNGGESQTLIATVSPENCTQPVVWSANPTGIVTVENGLVTSVANGEATITATCGSYSATCAVTVSGIEEQPGNEPITLTKTLTQGKGFNTNTGEVNASSDPSYGVCEEYIPVIKGNTYTINGCGAWVTVLGYNSDKTFNKVILKGSSGVTTYEFINDCDYIRVGCNLTSGITITITGVFGESGGGTNLVFQVNSASMNTVDNTLTDNIAGISATLTGNPTVSDNQIAFTASDKFSFDISSLNLTNSNRTIRIKFTPTTLDTTLRNVIGFGKTNWNDMTTSYINSTKLILQHGTAGFTNNTVGNTGGANGNNRLSTVPITGREYELVISENIDKNVRYFIGGTLVQDGIVSMLFDPLCINNENFIGNYSLIEIYNEYCETYEVFTSMVNA